MAQVEDRIAQLIRAKGAALGVGFLNTLPGPSHAHTRWFTTLADDATAPLPLTRVFSSPGFLVLLLGTLAVLAAVHAVDNHLRTHRGAVMDLLHGTDQLMRGMAPATLRLAMALYFASIASMFDAAPITLTPELASPGKWVTPVQWGIAAALLSPHGVVPACLGMLLLYAYSAHVHGWVHMLDYHLFAGICAFLVLHRVQGPQGVRAGLLVLRLTLGSSFLWVGVEKWLYPQWTEDVLLHQLPLLLMGMDPRFVVTAAGFVEVALAFLVLFGGVSSQVAAGVLACLLVAAIPLAGMVDAAGHLPMVVALVILATTRNRLGAHIPRVVAAAPLDLCGTFVITMPGFVGVYFVVHELAASERSGYNGNVSLSILWVLVLLTWLGYMALQEMRLRRTLDALRSAGRA